MSPATHSVGRRGIKRSEIVFTLLQLVPPGYTITYRLLAALSGTSPRAIGAIMRSNKKPIIIPCHRVIRSNGDLGGYSRGGPSIKRKLLEIEGVKFKGNRVSKRCIIDNEDMFWKLVEKEGYTLNLDYEGTDPQS